MTKVLIVGKTHMGKKLCLGGISVNDCRSLRILPISGDGHEKSAPFDVGDVNEFDLEDIPHEQITAPHTENVRLKRWTRRHGKATISEQKEFILRRMGAPFVEPEQLFDGCLETSHNQRAFIPLDGTIPRFSTGFWRFRRDLHCNRDPYKKRKFRYLCCTDDSSCEFDDEDLLLDIPYVGVGRPEFVIPAGTILRFSLSREFRGGFWLQLSGWFL